MTKKIQLFLLVGVIAVLFTSCQNEENEVVNPETETLSKATPLTTLLQRVAMVDPTTDNIIDSTDCFKVKLPVEVLVNNQPILVTSEEDFATVEAAFALYPSQYNTIDFVFPITVIYPDSSEVMIGSESEFYIKAHECDNVEVPVDEQPVNCLTIVYPLNLFTYNSEFQVADNYTFMNDAQLFAFIAGLGPQDYYGINYPMTVKNQYGVVITVQSNDQLWALIIQAISDCGIGEPVNCENGVSYFSPAYTTMSGLPNVTQEFSMDARVHEYKFLVKDVYSTICSIGYQSEPSTVPINYTIQIENQLGDIIYSSNHVFSSSQTEYVTLNDEITLTPNSYYIIRRIAPIGQGAGLGRFIERSENLGPQPPLLPFETENMIIVETKFYAEGGSADPDLHRVPFIDIIFKN